MKKIDYAFAGLIGFFVGIFAIPTVINLNIHTKVAMRLGLPAGLFLALLPWIMAVMYLAALWIGDQLARKLPIFLQITKFGAVGAFNTVIDFGIFNLLMLLSYRDVAVKIAGGYGGSLLFVVLLNTPGFVIAVINSFYWNKWWVFQKNNNEKAATNFPQFLVITVLGSLINSGIVWGTTVISASGLSSPTFFNAAKAGATIITLIWNFLGYKFIVFKSREPIAPI